MAASAPTAHAAETSGIIPGVLYTYRGFIKDSGISKSRIRDARLQGVQLPTVRVGRRIFIRGTEAITYIERLAELTAANSSPSA